MTVATSSSTSRKLESYCTITSSKRIYASDYFNDGVPFVRGKEIVRRFRTSGSLDSELYIARNKFEQLRDRFGAPVEGDLLLTSVGTLGIPYLVKPDDEFYFKDGNLIWFRGFEGLSSRFLYYWLQSPRGHAQLSKCTIGTSQPAYTIERLKEIEVDPFSLNQQLRIAAKLSAYDDLIENNRRRIQLLEQAARLLYKEWFVHFRFPGHEHVKIVDGMPEGWTKKLLSEISDITMGQSPKSSYYNEEGNGLPFHQGVTNFGVRFPSHQTYCTVLNRMAEPGDILFSVRAPVGRINITPDKIVIGRGIAAIRSNCDQQNLLFYALKNHFFKEDMMGGGAIFAAITKKDLHEVELIQAPDKIARAFMEHVQPIDIQIQNLQRKIDALTQARDLLLPRLMNGKVAV